MLSSEKRRSEELLNNTRHNRLASVHKAPAKRKRKPSVAPAKRKRNPSAAPAKQKQNSSIILAYKQTKKGKNTALSLGYSFERVLKCCGQASTEVWKHSSGKLVVAKKPYEKNAKHLENEIDILKSTLKTSECSTIIEFLGECKISNAPAMLLELCEYGDLWDYRSNANSLEKSIPESFISKVLAQLSSAVAYLHTGYGTNRSMSNCWIPVAHRDIKADNVLLVTDPYNMDPIIKLVDFGCAIVGEANIKEQEGLFAGTAAWQGPEARVPLVNKATDIWGIGAVIHWLAVGEMPIDEVNYPPEINNSLQEMKDKYCPRRLIDFRLPPNDRQSNSPSKDSQLSWNLTYSDELWNIVKFVLEFDYTIRPCAVTLVDTVNIFITTSSKVAM